jgi:hypothetical protein
MQVFVAQAVSTAVLDFIIFAIPIQLCLKPKAEKKTRLCLLGLFILGFLYVTFDTSSLLTFPSRWTLMTPGVGSSIDKPGSSILCAILRMVFVIQNFTQDTFLFDPSWYDATTAGLASLEVHLAAVCAALPVFWPVLTTTWDRIFVTTVVTVTREVGPFQRPRDVERGLHSTSSRGNLARCDELQSQSITHDWEPYVGDEGTGLGENETVVEGPAVRKW